MLWFNKQIPQKTHISRYSNKVTNKNEVGEKVIYCMYQNNKTYWEMDIIGEKKRRIGNMVYLVKGPKFVHKRHLKQIEKKKLSNLKENNHPEEEAMDIMFDTFNMPAP